MKQNKPTTDQRRAFVLSMRDACMSYEQIAAEAIKKFGKENLPSGYNKRLACLDLKRELNNKSPDKLKSELRRNKIFQYRMSGMTYHQIIEKLRTELGDDLPEGYTERHACRDLKRYLRRIDTGNKEEIVEAKNLYRERLNFLLNILWDKASQGDFQAIDRILKVIEALSRLDGMTNIAPPPTSPAEGTFNSFANLSEYLTKLNGKGNGNNNE